MALFWGARMPGFYPKLREKVRPRGFENKGLGKPGCLGSLCSSGIHSSHKTAENGEPRHLVSTLSAGWASGG